MPAPLTHLTDRALLPAALCRAQGVQQRLALLSQPVQHIIVLPLQLAELALRQLQLPLQAARLQAHVLRLLAGLRAGTWHMS